MPHDITYMCNLKNTQKTVNIIKQKQNKTKKQTHRYREQTFVYTVMRCETFCGIWRAYSEMC